VDLPTRFAVFIYNTKKEIIARYSRSEVATFINTLTPTENAGEFEMTIEASHNRSWNGEVYWKYMEQQVSEDNEDGVWTNKTKMNVLATFINDSETQYEAV